VKDTSTSSVHQPGRELQHLQAGKKFTINGDKEMFYKLAKRK
jgi:hypothetical protein